MSLLFRSTLRIIKTKNFSHLPIVLFPQDFSPTVTHRSIARWVAPTLKELKKRKERFQLPLNDKRKGFIEWNYAAEIYAFGMRFNENFNVDLLQQAFTHRSYIIQEELRQQSVGIEEPVINIKDNRELAVKGKEIMKKYVTAFLKYHLPKYPDEGIDVISNFLLSTEKLAYISCGLGTKEIIMTEEYPPSQETYAMTLCAIVGALSESQANGDLERPYNFVRDFVCTQLNQVDVNEIWAIEKPFEMLQKVCAERNVNELEPRILGETGKNTLLASCRIGIYDAKTKKLLGTGFGENYDNAIETASINALSKIWGSHNLKPFNYEISVNECFSALLSQNNNIKIAA